MNHQNYTEKMKANAGLGDIMNKGNTWHSKP
jgi:hypothetical protein